MGMTKSYYAGMDLDAPCGRCKSETVHRILSITDGVPEKIICVSCKSVHKFREVKPVNNAAIASKARAPRLATPGTPKASSASPNRFHELMTSEQAGSKAQKYSVTVRWEEGQWLDHPSFGLGRVQHRSGKKVEVLFRDGLKTLISG
jgi:hypothetical protein